MKKSQSSSANCSRQTWKLEAGTSKVARHTMEPFRLEPLKKTTSDPCSMDAEMRYSLFFSEAPRREGELLCLVVAFRERLGGFCSLHMPFHFLPRVRSGYLKGFLEPKGPCAHAVDTYRSELRTGVYVILYGHITRS